MSATPATIVIGLGNPILGDDGVGWRVAEGVKNHLETGAHAPVEVDCLAVGGLSLMERLIGYRRAILIDAINTHHSPVGTLYCLPLEDLPNQALGHLSSAHDTTVQNAIAMGRSMGAALPETITVVAIESEYVYHFSETLTPPVARAVPGAVQKVLELLEQHERRA